MPNFAPLKPAPRTFENATRWLTEHGFAVENSTPGVNACRVTSNGCVAEITAAKDGAARISSFPACLVGGEVAELVDRGYQKFFKTSKLEIAATAERLHALHEFSEALKEAIGYTSLYNEGLGSVSESYHYDRVVGRDLAENDRPQRPWEK